MQGTELHLIHNYLLKISDKISSNNHITTHQKTITSQTVLDDTLNTAAPWTLNIEEQVICLTLLLVMHMHTYRKLSVRDVN